MPRRKGSAGPRVPRPHRDAVAFGLAFAAALTGYTLTLPPSITLEDAGELAVAANWLGVPHPPGYPIWTFLTWLVQWIFQGATHAGHPNPAWGAAFASALFGAGACGFLAALTARCCRDLAANLPAGPSRILPLWKSWAVGLGAGLLLSLSVQTLPWAIGGGLWAITALGILALTLLRFLPDEAAGWRAKLPDAASFGSFFYGLLISVVAWFAAWSQVLIPSATRVLPLALALALSAFALVWGGDMLLGLAARMRPGNALAGADVTCGVAAGILLAFTPLMWSQSVIIEVYSLNALFIAAILWLTHRYLHVPHDRILYTTAFLFALGLTNHQALLFFVFFLVAGLAASGRKNLLRDGLLVAGLFAAAFFFYKARQYHGLEDPAARGFFLLLVLLALGFSMLCGFVPGGPLRTWRKLLFLLFLGTLGLGFHGFMAIASEQNPPMNWGYARTPEGFLRTVTRGQYARFEVADNFRHIARAMASRPDVGALLPGNERDLLEHHAQRTFFTRQLGAFFHDPAWKTSIASQFSWQFPAEPAEPTGAAPPPPERNLPLALLGLLPLVFFTRFDGKTRSWFHCTLVGMFFVTVVFLVIQWPELNHNDLFVKRVQYVQAHVFFAHWMALGGFLLLLLLHALLPRRATLALGATALLALFTAFPLHKEFTDPRHHAFVGASSQRGLDHGWFFGHTLIRGIHGLRHDMQHSPHDRFLRPPPHEDYPPEMAENAIIFGGTDPGRFVPTYMLYSADVRPDLFLLTQNALADSTYLNTMRDLYGDKIFIPDVIDLTDAFASFINHLRVFDPARLARTRTGTHISVEGAEQVNHINFHLARLIWEKNRDRHAFYVEESYVIPWMSPYLRPHGLGLKLEARPVTLTAEDVRKDFEFWEWVIEHLMGPAESVRRDGPFQRDLMARKTFSKLRGAIAGVYDGHGMAEEAERAYLEALRLYPGSPETADRLTRHYVRRRRLQDARAMVAHYAAFDPTANWVREMTHTLGRMEAHEQRLRETERNWETQPSGNTALQLVSLYANLDMIPEMETFARKLLEMTHLEEEFYPTLAAILRLKEHQELLEKTLLAWGIRFPNSWRPVLDVAAITLSERDYATTFQMIDEAIRRDPFEVPARLQHDRRFFEISHWEAFEDRVRVPTPTDSTP